MAIISAFGDPQDLTYKGVKVRRNQTGMINVSDLWRAEGSPSTLRPDIWLKQVDNQRFVNRVESKHGSPVWMPLKGGKVQGTFAVPEVAVRYASSLSNECWDWLCHELDTPVRIPKAKREIIHLGDIPLEVFQLASGEYRLSQTQVAEAIGKEERSFREFLASKSPEALPYKGFQTAKLPVENSNAPINPLPIVLAIAYWTKEAHSGNVAAVKILAASAKEAIERRADKAFGVQRTEEEYNFRFRNAFERLIDFRSECSSISSAPHLMTLAERSVFKKLRRDCPKEMFSLTREEFVDQLRLLASETDDWHLTHEKGFTYPDGAAHRNAYPHLITKPFEVLSDGQPQTAVVIFQAVDTIVDEKYIKDCVYLRDYIEIVKDQMNVDHALLFFVSPYGVTEYAATTIKEDNDLRRFVGVVTVRQLANFLYERAAENKKDNIRLGRVRTRFNQLLNYKLLNELEEMKQLPIELKVSPIVQLNLFEAS